MAAGRTGPHSSADPLADAVSPEHRHWPYGIGLIRVQYGGNVRGAAYECDVDHHSIDPCALYEQSDIYGEVRFES